MSDPTPQWSVRLFILAERSGFVVARRGAIKVWSRAVEALILARAGLQPNLVSIGQGLTELSLSLDVDGAVTGLHLDRSSGDAKLDRACMALVEALGAFPPAPNPIQGARLVLQIEHALVQHRLSA